MKWLKSAVAAASCLLHATITNAERFYQLPIISESRKLEDAKNPVNIAIIGAGAGGASTAYHLHRYAAEEAVPINITIFERNSYIGGRSTTVNAYDDPSQPVELGASIFVQVNRILREAVDEFGLSTNGRNDDDSDDAVPGAALAIWDGSEFVFVQQRASTGWWDIARLLWKYGLAPLRTMMLMKRVVAKFLKMYDEPRFPFASLTKVAEDVGLSHVVATTGEDFLAQNGITGDFGRHVVQASTRVNYAQNLRYIHGLEAMVCMAAENAMSVDGGNWKIFEGMIKASKATTLLSTSVRGLEMLRNDSSYLLSYDTVVPGSSDEDRHVQNTQRFDAVVLAAPYQFANLSFSSPCKHHPYEPDTIPYVNLHVTLFTSPHLLSPAFFNLSADEPAPRVILTTLPASETPSRETEGVGSPGFFSISLLRSLTNPSTGKREYLYKIFSPAPPTSDFISRLLGVNSSSTSSSPSSSFQQIDEKVNDSSYDSTHDHDDDDSDLFNSSTITWLHRKKWQSYPYEYPRVTYEELKLAPNLWYTSGIESFISTMETSALMGRNVAKIVVEDRRRRRDFQDLVAALREDNESCQATVLRRQMLEDHTDFMNWRWKLE